MSVSDASIQLYSSSRGLIESYGAGGFLIAGVRHPEPILVSKAAVVPWEGQFTEPMTALILKAVRDSHTKVVLFGIDDLAVPLAAGLLSEPTTATTAAGAMTEVSLPEPVLKRPPTLPPALSRGLLALSAGWEIMKIGPACWSYNHLFVHECQVLAVLQRPVQNINNTQQHARKQDDPA